MTLLIGQITPDEQIKYNILDYSKIRNVCNLDKQKTYTIYIMNIKVNDFGLILETDIILDELLITYNIDCIYYKMDDSKYLLNACSYYGVKVYPL